MGIKRGKAKTVKNIVKTTNSLERIARFFRANHSGSSFVKGNENNSLMVTIEQKSAERKSEFPTLTRSKILVYGILIHTCIVRFKYIIFLR